MSSFGETYRVSIYGSSHGPCVGVKVEGIPAGFAPDIAALQQFLDRRAPGRTPLSSSRKETDVPEFTAGLADGVATGAQLIAVIPNTDVRKEDYVNQKRVPRPGHADYPAMVRFGEAYGSGGGAFSGRMTAPLCVAGGLALQLLAQRDVEVTAWADSIGGETDPERFEEIIAAAKAEGDSVGGTVTCRVTGLPVGLGGPLWDGLESLISAAVFGIPAVKGVEFGAGFRSAAVKGSENNDGFYVDESGTVRTRTNHAGGILGGMSDGMPLTLRAAFKPTPSIAKPQRSVELSSLRETEISVVGRHDPCIVPRAIPCVEAAVACAVLDALLTAERGEDLISFRREMDRIDRALLQSFDRRMELSDRIGAWKKERGVPVRDPKRELEKLEAVEGQSAYPGAARELFEMLMRLSREEQTRK